MRQTSALARLAADQDLQEAPLLAVTANSTLDDSDTRAALYEVATATPQIAEFVDFGTAVALADATPDGNTIVAGLADGRVLTVDRLTGTRKELGSINGTITFVGISDDGATVAASAERREAPSSSPASGGADLTFTMPNSKIWENGVQRLDVPNTLKAISPNGQVWVFADWSSSFGVRGKIEISGAIKREMADMSGQFLLLGSRLTTRGFAAIDEYGFYLSVNSEGVALRTRIPMGTYMFGGDVSSNFTRVTYTNGTSDIEVWDILRDTGEEEIEPSLEGWTPDANQSGLVLDDRGERMAVAADGRIHISQVSKTGKAASSLVTLRGAGASPDSLHFLGAQGLISASGNSVTIWELDKTSTLAESMSVELDFSCAACATNEVAVSPDGEKAFIYDPGNQIVDFKSDRVFQLLRASGTIGALWMDSSSLLTIDEDGQCTVFGADLHIERSFSIAAGGGSASPQAREAGQWGHIWTGGGSPGFDPCGRGDGDPHFGQRGVPNI